jgi:lipoyl(octanoyl) transferase
MPATYHIHNLGLKPYGEVLQLQESLFNKNLQVKEQGLPTENHLILCEHNPVYTLGKSGKRENILATDEQLDAEFYQIQRGGDVTFHGPGQLVVYPIFDLDTFSLGVGEYIYKLEETIIETLKEYGLRTERVEGAAGVWIVSQQFAVRSPQLNTEIPLNSHPFPERKICAIGAKVSRHVTMHGLAININTDLSYFMKIVACGLEGKGVTSLAAELGREVDMDEYKKVFLEKFTQQF